MGADELATLRLVGLALPADERALVERAADELARLRAALLDIRSVLGDGPCAAIGCQGCGYEFAEAADLAREALGAGQSQGTPRPVGAP